MTNKLLTILVLVALTAMPTLADYKITQKRTFEGMGQETTIYSKGVRQRTESKLIMDGDAEEMAMMAKMMPPSLVQLSQCDLKQNVSINEAQRSYFIDYYDWSAIPAEQKARRPNQKIVIKGTSTISSTLSDSGNRQQMFGMTAKWLKAVQSIENSLDSCDGKVSVRVEQEGWFVDLVLPQHRCQAPPIGDDESSAGGCRPKLIVKGTQDPGFLLTGTMKMFQDNKLQTTSKVETTALSKAPLDQALFEIPRGFKEVDLLSELTNTNFDPSLIALPNSRPSSSSTPASGPSTISAKKRVAIDLLTGNIAKIDQASLRSYIASKVSDSGMMGIPVNSPHEIAGGNFANVISIEVKKIKESSGAKIGGLFGKVTGSDDAGKLGDTEAEIAITIFGQDGKVVAAGGSTSVKVKGKTDDALRAAVDKLLGGLLEKVR